MDLAAFLDTYGLAAVFALMLVKAIGVPIPIPADLIMLVTAARVAEGRWSLPAAFGAILLAMFLGGLGQFALVRRLGRPAVDRYGRYVGLTSARLEATAGRLGRGGPAAVALAVATPGVRLAAIAGCGLVGIPARRFAPGLALGSALLLSFHFFVGYALGKLLAASAEAISQPAPLLGGALVGLAALLGLGAWLAIRRRRGALDAFGAWTEAACPICLLHGARERLSGEPPVAGAPTSAPSA